MGHDDDDSGRKRVLVLVIFILILGAANLILYLTTAFSVIPIPRR